MPKTPTPPGSRDLARRRRGAPLVCALLLACQEDFDCSDGYCDASELEYSSPAPAPCDTLDESTCEHSSHCIMDSLCVSARSCNGPGCTDLCELVRACVPYR